MTSQRAHGGVPAVRDGGSVSPKQVMQDGVYQVHTDVVVPIVRAHLERLTEAQWVLLANGTADSSTQVLLADMCGRATHKLCAHAAALVAAESARGRPPPTVSLVGGMAAALAEALDVAPQPSVSARKLDAVLQEEMRARVRVSLAARAAAPLHVPTTFTETDVLAKMVLLTGGVLKVHLSKRDRWRREATRAGNACAPEPGGTSDLGETAEAVGRILRKWTDPKQEVKTTAVEIAEIIIKDLHCPGFVEQDQQPASSTSVDLALIREPLTRLFRCHRAESDHGSSQDLSRDFLNFCRTKFEELTSEVEQVRYQGTLTCRDRDPPTAQDSALAFPRSRSRIEDIFKWAANDADGLRSMADKLAAELADKMYCYVMTKRSPVHSLEVGRRPLDAGFKKTDNLQVLTMILEDFAKTFVQQLLLWLRMEPGTRQNRADELCGCLNDIQRFFAAQSAPGVQEDALALRSPTAGTLDNLRPLKNVSTGIRVPEENSAVARLQEYRGGHPALVAIGDSCHSENVSTVRPENEPALHWQDSATHESESPLLDAIGDSRTLERVSAQPRSPENKPVLCFQEHAEAPEPKNLSLDAVGDFCPSEKISVRNAGPENKPEAHSKASFAIPEPEGPIAVVTGDSCTLERISSEVRNPENLWSKKTSPGKCCSLEKVPAGTTNPKNTPEVHLQKDADSFCPENLAPASKGDSNFLEQVCTASTGPENKPDIHLQEDTNPSGSESPAAPDTIGHSYILENVSTRNKSPENQPKVCVQEATAESGCKRTSPDTKRDLEEFPIGTTSPANIPGVFFQEDVDTAGPKRPSREITGISGTKSDMDIPESKSLCRPQPSPVYTRTSVHRSDTNTDSCPPLLNDAVSGTSPACKAGNFPLAQPKTSSQGDPDDAGSKTTSLDTSDESCSSLSNPLCLQEAEMTGGESPNSFGAHADVPTDKKADSQTALDLSAARPQSASPFRPMCTVNEELLTLVDVVMVQLFAGLPEDAGRLVLSRDVVAAAHRVSRRITEDALPLPWAKLGPCKLNRTAKEVVQGLKRQFSTSQKLVDVFLFEPDAFDDAVLKLLASGLDASSRRRRASPVGGLFFRAFCVGRENEPE